MRLLSALDALFLQLETPDTPMHVGSLMLLARPKRRGGRDPYTAIRAHLAARIHLAPVFWHKLAPMPAGLASPAWIRAEPDLDYHVRRMSLPAPGTRAQLEDAVARLHESVLDHSRPLWQVTVIEGLESGEIGYYSKVHHAALDGQGGIAVAQAVLDTQATPRKVDAKRPEVPRLSPTTARLLGSALRHTVARYGAMLKGIPDLAKAVARGGTFALTASDLRRRGIALGPRTRLNAPIRYGRRFATVQIPLDEAKAIARHYEGKLNDAVLATVAGALRREFAKEPEALAEAMIGAVPLSLRAPGDTAAANQVSMMLVALATQVADPAKRMRAIIEASGRAKTLAGSVKGAIPTDLPSLGIPWLMAVVTPLYRKAVESKRAPVLANLAISNVPGPQVPLYLAGMELTAYYPVSIVTHGLGLNVTIVSYAGSLDYGLVAAKSAIPDLRRFARHVAAAHHELLQSTKGRKTVKKKTSSPARSRSRAGRTR
jgi:WS/DGAT/MGAT family acyltransferase